MSVLEILNHINEEDTGIPAAVRKCLIPAIDVRLYSSRGGQDAGRWRPPVLPGAGTSGRLGILDAPGMPAHIHGVPHELVIADCWWRQSHSPRCVEHREDDTVQGWKTCAMGYFR